jgi:hypothetical protein
LSKPVEVNKLPFGLGLLVVAVVVIGGVIYICVTRDR